METTTFKCAWTIGELKQYCEKNGCRYEIREKKSEHFSFITGKYEQIVIGYYIGINNMACRSGLSTWIWTWFETSIIDEDTDMDTCLVTFSERYSMNNGRSYRGVWESIRAYETLSRKA